MAESRVAAVVLRRTFAAPCDTVFPAFTNAQALRQWWCPTGHIAISAEVDVRESGHFRVKMQSETTAALTNACGEYLKICPPSKLVFTHFFESDETPAADLVASAFEQQTLVTVEFIERGDATEIILTQENLPSEDMHTMFLNGWGNILNSLGRFLQDACGSFP